MTSDRRSRRLVARLQCTFVNFTRAGRKTKGDDHGNRMEYPLSQELSALIDEVKDWQLVHGSLLKLVLTENEHTILARPVGATVFPSPFPRSCFDEARALATIYNDLYAKVASSEAWLEQALSPLLGIPSIASKLWTIHQQAKQEGIVQPLSLGIFRSDYMLQEGKDASPKPQLKQVEFNSFSCAGIAHSSRMSRLHQHICRTGRYSSFGRGILPGALPANDNVSSICKALARAHSQYGPPKSSQCSRTCILMLVQPNNINIADERPFEYALWDCNTPCYRVMFGADFLACTSITETRELLYYPSQSDRTYSIEVSVAYLRAGYDGEEFTDDGMACRLRIECSWAIKCPNILGHLATLKLVQERLASENELERFLPENEAERIRKTFMPMYRLDKYTDKWVSGSAARGGTNISNFVLKPSLEGGGHNVYGNDIPDFVHSIESNHRDQYVIMDMIRPPWIVNVLVSPQELYEGEVESELGIAGACLWRQDLKGKGVVDILSNEEVGFTLKTKAKGVNEMSVVKGYGCFDSPLLVNELPTLEISK
ncbi:MAG: hypothetical protein MMC23_001868 [Stictis urceolatum]|nr:hypothetical protein [Stictis urceolata]